VNGYWWRQRKDVGAGLVIPLAMRFWVSFPTHIKCEVRIINSPTCTVRNIYDILKKMMSNWCS